jgi:hypothetical protein
MRRRIRSPDAKLTAPVARLPVYAALDVPAMLIVVVPMTVEFFSTLTVR